MKQFCYERIELKVEGFITSVSFKYNDNETDIVYPFYYQPIGVSYDEEGIEHIKPNGKAIKLIRYTPKKVGFIEVSYLKETEVFKTDTLEILPSKKHGYIKVSNRDKRYFEYTDGTPFVPIGINTCFPTSYGVSNGNEFGLSGKYKYIGTKQYEAWFNKLSQSGVNLVRLWLGYEYFNPETENANEFDLVQFSKIDAVIKLAKKYGLKLKLTLEQFRFFKYEQNNGRVFNLFNKKLYLDGKPCENTDMWLNEERFKNAWLNKITEFAKRYAGDTEIFAIELWNEMNGVYSSKELITEWNKQMLPKVKELFKSHLVTNSLGSMDNANNTKLYKEFCWDKTDFMQLHRYLDQGVREYGSCRENPIELLSEGLDILSQKDRPLIVAETGAVNNCHSGPFKYYSSDDNGIIFADCVYTPIFCESAGCGNIWHWDERYVEFKNLYRMFNPIKELLQGVDMPCEDFKKADLSNDNAYVLLLKGKSICLGYVRNKTADWKSLLRDLKESKEIERLEINLDCKEIEIVDVWNENTTAEAKNGSVIFKNIGCGFMFKAII